MRRGGRLWVCSAAAQLGTEVLATGPAHGNAIQLLGVKSGARARLDKERVSGHVDASSHHLWKITRQLQPEHNGQHVRKENLVHRITDFCFWKGLLSPPSHRPHHC